MSLRPRRARVRIQPTATRASRKKPTQYCQTARAESHQAISIVAMKPVRLERNRTVYNDSMVHHMAATNSMSGNIRNTNFAAAVHPDEE